ncbi:MAG TPA: pitrilysin family protein [Chitinophagaceae bacterium]|jgi:zinc protease|nr:pitrilysin family protein [Chitinophagaceae bacterium]
MKQRFLLVVALSFVLFASVNAQTKLVEKVTKQGSEIVIPYEKYVLPNGLTLIIHEDHSDPVVYVDVTYHVGSAREEIGKSGFAHFFEHMMFQGSDHVADEQHFKIVSDAGGTLNGSTNRDRTNYYETVPSNQLEKMLWLEADRMGFLLDAVTQKKFENQRSTVKNEKGQNYENVPYRGALETQYKTIYPYGHPYSWLTIGYVEDLNRVEVNDLKNFFLRWYGPNNATVTVAGDVKPADVIKLAEKYFGVIPRGPEVKPVILDPVAFSSDRYVSYVDNYARTPQLSFTYPTVPVYSKEMAALQCLSQVIGQGRNSVLYQQFVKKKIAQSATAFSTLTELAGEFSVSISPLPGKNLAEIEKLYRAALDSFEARGVTDDDIAKFKGGQESQLINGLQSVQGKGAQLAQFQTFTGNPNKIADLLKMYSSLTKEEVMSAYNKYIKGKNAVILSIVPKSQEAIIAAQDNFKIDSSHYNAPDYGYAGLKYAKAKDVFDRSKIPGNGPNPTVKVPAFWKKDLANGAKVIGTLNSELPTVTFSLSIPGGHLVSETDKTKVGLAGFFADMMGEDTKNYTAEQLAVELQKLGSTLNVSSSVDGVDFTVQSLKKNLDKTLELLQERLFNPKFTQQSYDRLQGQAAQYFKQLKGNPAAVASNVFAKVNYGPTHILGMSEDGTDETVKNIKLEDIENYYKNYMTSVDAKVVVVGDISEAEILPKLAFLDKLPKKKITLPKIEPTPAIAKTLVYMVDVPKGAQTEFRVGYSTGLAYNATGDYYKSQLMNYPLGGSFNSRLNLNLREDKGWTYGARSGFSGDEYSGDFEFSSGIRADATDSALSEVMREIRDYAMNGPTDEELSFMKNAIGQNDALRYETGVQKAAFIRRILDYNLPANYVAQQNKILQSLTKDQVKSLASKYLNSDKMNILLVGDKAKIFEGVKKLGYEIIELDADGKKVEKKGF